MNRETQARLVAVLKDAMNAQGITQSDLARHIGTSSGMMSSAFSCNGQMREERWRMCCERCGVDFDQFLDSRSSHSTTHTAKGGTPMPPTLTRDQLCQIAQYIEDSLPTTILILHINDYAYISSMTALHDTLLACAAKEGEACEPSP